MNEIDGKAKYTGLSKEYIKNKNMENIKKKNIVNSMQ